jgi:two-component system, OmpR family, phosphate regulon response regulator PhoB
MPCTGPKDFLSTSARFRPDIVIVGPEFHRDDLRLLAASLTTSGLGLAIVGMDEAGFVERFGTAKEEFRRIEIEPFELGTDAPAVVLRLRALLRRCRPAALLQKLSYGDMVLDEAALTLSIGQKVAPLALEGFRILGPLFDSAEHVWTREELLPLVYGSRTTNSMRIVDVKLNVTRRRLRAVLGTDPVQTVRGHGYRLAKGQA